MGVESLKQLLSLVSDAKDQLAYFQELGIEDAETTLEQRANITEPPNLRSQAAESFSAASSYGQNKGFHSTNLGEINAADSSRLGLRTKPVNPASDMNTLFGALTPPPDTI